jgi:hypothetical protein
MIVGSPKTIANELEIIEAKIYNENSSYLY